MRFFSENECGQKTLETPAKRVVFGLCSFVLPVLCMLAVLVGRGVMLRGDASLFSADGAVSLLQRIEAVRAASSSGSLYSFAVSSGTCDIFFWLVSLLPLSLHATAVLGVLVSVAFLSLAFYLAASHLGARTFPALVTSLLYGMSSFSFVCMFFPGAGTFLFLLPLLVAALHLLVTRGYTVPFAVVLAAGMLTYLRGGFVLLVASLLWLFFDLFALSAKETRIKTPSALLRYAVGVLVSLSFSIGALVSALAAVEWVIPSEIEANFDLLSLLLKMLPATYDGITSHSLPYAYVGLLVLLAVPVYFACTNLPRKERIGAAILSVVTLFGVSLFLLSRLWDWLGADAVPSYLPIAFFGFLLLLFSARGLSHATAQNRRPSAVFAAYGFLLLLLLFAQKLPLTYVSEAAKTSETYVNSVNSVWVSLFVLTALCGAVYGYITCTGKRRNLTAVLLLLVVMAEVTFGQAKLLQSYQNEHTVYSRTSVNTYTAAMEKAKEFLATADTDGFRAETVSSALAGDYVLFGTSTASAGHMDDGLRAALIRLGMAASEDGVSYTHISPALDTLLGVRYLVAYTPQEEEAGEEDPAPDEPSEEEEESKLQRTIRQIKEAFFPLENIVAPLPATAAGTVSSLYRAVYTDGDVTVYENPYALPMLTTVSGDLSSLDFALPDEDDFLYDDRGNITGIREEMATGRLYTPVERLNAIWGAITGQSDVSLFVPLTDSVLKGAYNSTRTTDALGQTVYTVTNKNNAKNAKMTLDANLEVGTELLLCLPSITGCEADVYLDGVYAATVNRGNKAENGMISLGYHESGRVQIDVFYARRDASAAFAILPGIPYLYIPDDGAFEALMQTAPSAAAEVESQTEHSLTVRLRGESGTQVLTAFPSEAGLTVKVNGTAVGTYSALDGLLAFDLPESGEQTVVISQTGRLTSLYTAFITSAVQLIRSHPQSFSQAMEMTRQTVAQPGFVYAMYATLGSLCFVLLLVAETLRFIRRTKKRKQGGDHGRN